jgi:Domain of unknown function (DUF1905)
MTFRAYVEPPEPMRGLEVPPEVVEALGGGRRPPVIITINGHSWRSRVAIMRGRFLLGLSNANRQAASVATGDEVEVEVGLIPSHALSSSRRTSPAPSTPTRSPVPPTTGWPTATSASTCTRSRARRSPRRARGGSRRPWQCCGNKNRQRAARRQDSFNEVGSVPHVGRPDRAHRAPELQTRSFAFEAPIEAEVIRREAMPAKG